jgi:hypothetical protein
MPPDRRWCVSTEVAVRAPCNRPEDPPRLNSKRETFLLVQRSATSVGRRLQRRETSPTNNPTEDDMMERVLALLLAGTLVAPQTSLASESGLNDDGARQATSKFPDKLPLPPVPYLDTIPWIDLGSASKAPGIDILMQPEFNFPAIPKSSAWAVSGFGNVEPQPGRTATR